MKSYTLDSGVTIEIIPSGNYQLGHPQIDSGGLSKKDDSYGKHYFSVYNWILKAESIAKTIEIGHVYCYIPDTIYDAIYLEVS